MKRFGLLALAASLGVVTLPTHPALTFDGEAFLQAFLFTEASPLAYAWKMRSRATLIQVRMGVPISTLAGRVT